MAKTVMPEPVKGFNPEAMMALAVREVDLLEQVVKILQEIKGELRQGGFKYHIPRWTETPSPRLNDPDYGPGRTAPWYPTDPWGNPVPYCGRGGDRIYCGCGHEHYETTSSAEDRPRCFHGYRK